MKKKFTAIVLAAFLALSPFVIPSPTAYATVSSTSSKIIYLGDSASSTFSFTFPVFSQTDIVVSVNNLTTLAITTLTLTTNYTVTLASLGYGGTYNGSVTLLGSYAALSSDYQIIIQRVIPYTQLISLSDNSVTPAATYMQGYDRATMLAQQLQEQLNRSLLLPVSQTTPETLPVPLTGYAIGWASDGSLTNIAATDVGGLAVPIADTNLQTITTAGKVNTTALTETVVTLADGAGSVINAASGRVFSMTSTADRTLGTTINGFDGEKIIIRFTASGGARTLTLPVATTGDFAFGSDITALTQTASGKTDILGCVFSSTASRWYVVAVVKGY